MGKMRRSSSGPGGKSGMGPGSRKLYQHGRMRASLGMSPHPKYRNEPAHLEGHASYGKKSGQDDSVFGAAPSGAPAISDPNPPDADSPFEDSPDPGSERRSPMADAYSPDDTVQIGSEWQRRRLEAQSRVPEWETEFNSQKRGQ